jgi:hypothetical protein
MAQRAVKESLSDAGKEIHIHLSWLLGFQERPVPLLRGAGA